MTNKSSKGAPESESTGGQEKVLKFTGGWQETLQRAISLGMWKIPESSVIFYCSTECEKACQIARFLMGTKGLEDYVKAAEGMGKKDFTIIKRV